MGSFNKVILMGNLTRDPELRFTQGANSTAICKVGIAVNRRFKNQQGEWVDKPTFVDVTIFGNRGEAFSKHHSKGSTAFIEGRLELDTWEDKNSGQKRSKLYVIGENWEFAGGGRGEGGGGGNWQRSQGGGERQGGGWGDRQPSGAGSSADQGGYGDYGADQAEDFGDTPF